MRQVHRKLEKDGSGVLKLIAEDPEDMWHAYNLISVGDGYADARASYTGLVCTP